MGLKAAVVTIACNGLSALLWIIVAAMPNWLEKTFFLPGASFVSKAGWKVNAGILACDYEVPFCNAFLDSEDAMMDHLAMAPATNSGKAKKALESICLTLQEESGFLGMQDAFCGDPIKAWLIPQGCWGIVSLRWAGIIMFIFIILTIILQVVASFLIAYYFHVSPKRKYRVVALGFLVVAPCMDAIGLGMYAYAQSIFCGMMNNSRIIFMRGQAMGFGANVSIGWILATINTLLMFIVPFVVNVLKTKSERYAKEARMQKEFEQEMARYAYNDNSYGDGGGYGVDPYSGAALDPYGAPLSAYPGGAYDPYADQSQQAAGPYGYPVTAGGMGYG